MKYEIPTTDHIGMFRRAGMRVTAQRVAIYDMLLGSNEHPTAAMIYDGLKKQYPTLSLMTVYNTLNRLVDAGVVNDLGTVGDGFTHYDADTTAHVNLACTNCHQISDLASEYTPTLGADILARSGYQIQGSRLLYYGLCPSCQ